LIMFIEKSANIESLSKNKNFSIRRKALGGKGLNSVLSKYRKINITIHMRMNKKNMETPKKYKKKGKKMQWPKKEPKTPAPGFCKFCGNGYFLITDSGPHRKLSCAGCKRYLKFVNKDQEKELADNGKIL